MNAPSDEIAPQKAAEILNVSTEYLERLLAETRLPFRTTGDGPRLLVQDVLAYKQARDEERTAGLRELTRLSQEYGGSDAELRK
jgi:excisionase family DNA binding protein